MSTFIDPKKEYEDNKKDYTMLRNALSIVSDPKVGTLNLIIKAVLIGAIASGYSLKEKLIGKINEYELAMQDQNDNNDDNGDLNGGIDFD